MCSGLGQNQQPVRVNRVASGSLGGKNTAARPTCGCRLGDLGLWERAGEGPENCFHLSVRIRVLKASFNQGIRLLLSRHMGRHAQLLVLLLGGGVL